MGIFSQSIPDVPEHIRNKDYIITYDSDDNVYYLYSGYKTVTCGESEDFISASFISYKYKSDEWENVINGIGSYPVPRVCRSYTVSLVYSSYDLMTDSGEVYHYSGYSSNQNIICGTVSSSTILTSLKDSVLPLVPLVAFAVISFLGFRKAWIFIKGGVRGA